MMSGSFWSRRTHHRWSFAASHSLASCPGSQRRPARAAQTHTVTIVDFSFEPGQLTIAVGDTVTWTNEDGAAHTATATGGAFDSGNMEQGDAFSFTFASAGDYPYLCTYHPEMTGTIVVQAAAPSPSEGTTPSTAMPNADPGGRQLAGLMGLILVVISLLALATAAPPAQPRSDDRDCAGGRPATGAGAARWRARPDSNRRSPA